MATIAKAPTRNCAQLALVCCGMLSGELPDVRIFGGAQFSPGPHKHQSTRIHDEEFRLHLTFLFPRRFPCMMRSFNLPNGLIRNLSLPNPNRRLRSFRLPFATPQKCRRIRSNSPLRKCFKNGSVVFSAFLLPWMELPEINLRMLSSSSQGITLQTIRAQTMASISNSIND